MFQFSSCHILFVFFQIKCDQYWPNRGTETYCGIMHVTLIDVMELATYTIRTFQLARVRIVEILKTKIQMSKASKDHALMICAVQKKKKLSKCIYTDRQRKFLLIYVACE